MKPAAKSLPHQIKALVYRDLLLEMRQKYALGGLLLYAVSTIFVCYLSFQGVINMATWNALFWIIILFSSVNAVAKSFIQEGRGRLLYLYTLASPQAIILSKILYNMMLNVVMGLITLAVYSVLMGGLIKNLPLFMTCLVLGSIGFATTLTLMSALVTQANNNTTLMAILSFPVLIPLIVTLITLSMYSLTGSEGENTQRFLMALIGIDALVIALAYLLFPYLWRD